MRERERKTKVVEEKRKEKEEKRTRGHVTDPRIKKKSFFFKCVILKENSNYFVFIEPLGHSRGSGGRK